MKQTLSFHSPIIASTQSKVDVEAFVSSLLQLRLPLRLLADFRFNRLLILYRSHKGMNSNLKK